MCTIFVLTSVRSVSRVFHVFTAHHKNIPDTVHVLRHYQFDKTDSSLIPNLFLLPELQQTIISPNIKRVNVGANWSAKR